MARFPLPIHDRIPNFAGSESAAARAATLPEWTAARAIKCNPDAPQRALRLQALRQGKLVFVAVPRLRDAQCFLRLDPAKLGRRLAAAATIKGAAAHGEAIPPHALPPIDLIVAGSVAVNQRGARVGKGGGYSDLEYALARELGRVDERTPVLTTVHELQVVDGAIPMTAHDVPVDFVATPERVLRLRRAYRKPRGLLRDALGPEQLAAMPAVAAAVAGRDVRRSPRPRAPRATARAGRAPSRDRRSAAARSRR